jgi:hypothetical protein
MILIVIMMKITNCKLYLLKGLNNFNIIYLQLMEL